MIRRGVDILVSSIVLALGSPVLVAAALAIRLESRGGAIYRQRRAGLHGRRFDVLKLRTMVVGAETMGAGVAVNWGDERITRVGRVLRRLSIDELPGLTTPATLATMLALCEARGMAINFVAPAFGFQKNFPFAAQAETGSSVSSWSRPVFSASKVRYSVIIFVSDAG